MILGLRCEQMSSDEMVKRIDILSITDKTGWQKEKRVWQLAKSLARAQLTRFVSRVAN